MTQITSPAASPNVTLKPTMGLEAYLFNIEFKQSVLEQYIVGLFDKIGMIHLM